MSTKIKTIAWKCKYCGKRFFLASTCQHHELICRTNPINQHPCLNCKFLHKIDAYYYPDYCPGVDKEKIKTFFCERKRTGLYTHKVAVNKSHPAYVDGIMYRCSDDMEFGHGEMPLKCSEFQSDS